MICSQKFRGANRTQLVVQFIGESVLTALVSLIVAVVLVRLVLPEFNAFFWKQIEPSAMLVPGGLVLLFGTAGVVGIAAGAYPALVLASFQPVRTLKGSLRTEFRGRWIQKGLVVLQFAISILLIVGTGVIYQ